MAVTNRSMPIAVTDSGIGGLSTLYQLCKLMPNEDYIYFGDSLNNPYGTKDTEEVRRIVFENTQRLMSMGTKAIVVACNTATGAAVRALRNTYLHSREACGSGGFPMENGGVQPPRQSRLLP